MRVIRPTNSSRGPAAPGVQICVDTLEEAVGGLVDAQVLAPESGDHPAARRSLEEPELEEVRLVDVLDGVALLAERDRERRETDRAAAELVEHGVEELAVGALEADLVDLEQLERLAGDVEA